MQVWPSIHVLWHTYYAGYGTDRLNGTVADGRSESRRTPQDAAGRSWIAIRSSILNVTCQYTPLLNCASLKPGPTCNCIYQHL